ncbi:MAG: toxin-antitoxin system YwqK family antitoxin [Flavobacteriaceae bacterium]
MKALYLSILLLIGFSSVAQDSTPNAVVTKSDELTKVSLFHPNGELAQEGYLKNNLLHGKWVKYSEEGEKMCLANYKKGKREGTWLFWTDESLTEVEFKNNKILKKVSWENKGKLVSSQK